MNKYFLEHVKKMEREGNIRPIRQDEHKLLSESFRTNLESFNVPVDQVLYFNEVGFTSINEAYIKSEDVNDATRSKIEACKKKYAGEENIIFSVVSEGNAVTQNMTLYPYELLNSEINSAKFKSRLSTNRVQMQNDHPDWISSESVNKTSAVVREVFWEVIDQDPTKETSPNPSTTKATKATTNGKPNIRLYAVIQLFGECGEIIQEYAQHARVGISSRGYGYGEEVYNDAKEKTFLYYELKVFQLDTWDFVVNPSVEKATFEYDGVLNIDPEDEMPDSQVDDQKTQKNNESVSNVKTDDNNIPVTTEKNCTYDIISESQEEAQMTPEEIKKFLLENAEGKALFQAMLLENQKGSEIEKKIEALIAEKEKLNEDLVKAQTGIKEASAELETVKAEKEALSTKIAEIETATLEAKKDAFVATYKADVQENLKADLADCKTVESFEARVTMIQKYLPESAKADFKEEETPSIVEALEGETKEEVVTPETEEQTESTQKTPFEALLEKTRKVFTDK